MKRRVLFLAYISMRLRLFLREILELHQRFLTAFLYVFGLLLSGHEQLALRKGLAHFLSPEPSNRADGLYLAGFLLYGWVAAAVVRWSARGGRVHYFAESLPLSFAWERVIRALALTLVNMILLILFGMGWHQLMQNGGNWLLAFFWAAAYYVWILGLQLSLLEQNWRHFPFWILGAFLLLLGKGTVLAWPLLSATAVLAVWNMQRPRSQAHVHPELSFGTWEVNLRSAMIRRLPAAMSMQITYALTRPALLFYCLLIALVMNTLLIMVLKQDIPLSQKIYVYTCITGFLSIFLSSFFRSFHLQRNEVARWLRSLPRPDSWWVQQDTRFVSSLYLLLTFPFSLMLSGLGHLPLPVPFVILPIHGLGFMVLRVMQRSRHLEKGVLIVLGLSGWFILLAYICDHALRGMMR